jgi:hypothetical protein
MIPFSELLNYLGPSYRKILDEMKAGSRAPMWWERGTFNVCLSEETPSPGEWEKIGIHYNVDPNIPLEDWLWAVLSSLPMREYVDLYERRKDINL